MGLGSSVQGHGLESCRLSKCGQMSNVGQR